MGDFRVVVEATGGHGCQREYGAGKKVFGCRRMDCPDCLTQEYLEKLAKIAPISKAEFQHWPTAAQWGGNTIVDTFIPESSSIVNFTNTNGSTGSYVSVEPAHRVRSHDFPELAARRNPTG
jgi:hypothetical protein